MDTEKPCVRNRTAQDLPCAEMAVVESRSPRHIHESSQSTHQMPHRQFRQQTRHVTFNVANIMKNALHFTSSATIFHVWGIKVNKNQVTVPSSEKISCSTIFCFIPAFSLIHFFLVRLGIFGDMMPCSTLRLITSMQWRMWKQITVDCRSNRLGRCTSDR